jgi:hypothetical protein
MRSGQLRDSVRVERRAAETTHSSGNPTGGAFETLISAQPARIVPQGGSESVRADRLTGSVIWEVVLRWSAANAAILASDRFILERAAAGLPAGAALNIRHAGVDPSERRRELRFVCQSGVAT